MKPQYHEVDFLLVANDDNVGFTGTAAELPACRLDGATFEAAMANNHGTMFVGSKPLKRWGAQFHNHDMFAA